VRPDAPAHRKGIHERPRLPVDLIVFGVVLAVAALHFPLIFRINIGWDEFRFLSDVYGYRRGEITNVLQTFHVHLFRFLPYVGGTEVEQVIAGRGIYYLLLIGSCWFIYVLASTYISRAGALFAVLLFLSYSEVIGYGTTFRFDGLGVFLLLGSLALVARQPACSIARVGAAGLAALAVMVTLKSLFYIPTLLLVVMIGDPRAGWRRMLARGLAFGGAVVGLFGSLYFIHKAALPRATLTDSLAMMERVGRTGIKLSDPFPQAGYLMISAFMNLGTWLFLFLGIILLVRRLWRGERVRESLVLLAVLLPMVSLVVYRNSFPYFFVFLMPVGAVIAAVPFDELIRRHERREEAAAAVMGFVVLLCFAFHYNNHWRDETAGQRQLVDVVHKMFPDPVPYVDPNSMIASFPKVGFFMSHWGLEHYHAAGQSIFENLLVEYKPVFLLALDPLLPGDTASVTRRDRLLPEDIRVLRANFIHHWGAIHVAGKHAVVSVGEPTLLRLVIAGTYTLEADADVLINGQLSAPGDVLDLEPGLISLQTVSDELDVILRWGRNLYRPSEPPREGRVFRGFYPCSSPVSQCRRRAPRSDP
jgi:hypothetical protein